MTKEERAVKSAPRREKKGGRAARSIILSLFFRSRRFIFSLLGRLGSEDIRAL